MDLVAGLHWLRENLPAFNGDPSKVVYVFSYISNVLMHRNYFLFIETLDAKLTLSSKVQS